MSKLLAIWSSPRGEMSYSTKASEAFLAEYRQTHSGDTVDSFNVFNLKLPTYDGFTLDAKYKILHGKDHSEEEKEAWQEVVTVIDRFKSADKYLFSLPMWNFTIPYALKQYIDVLVQPGYTFSYTPEEGFKGLVTGKPACVICARGGEYPEGSEGAALDFQMPYMKTILGFIGFTDIRFIVIEPTLSAPDAVKKTEEEAIRKARELARDF